MAADGGDMRAACLHHRCLYRYSPCDQVAIRGQVGSQTFWYKCPQEGGKLYIPGFSGAFHCPPAEDFCRFEDASGIRYPETQLWWEWLFWGLLIGVPLLFLLLCGCSCIRERYALHYLMFGEHSHTDQGT